MINAGVTLVMRFDSTEPLPAHLNPAAARPGTPVVVSRNNTNPFNFELAVRSTSRCLPSLGQVRTCHTGNHSTREQHMRAHSARPIHMDRRSRHTLSATCPRTRKRRIAQVSVKWLTLHANATVWWDVLDHKMSIAIEHGGDDDGDGRDGGGGEESPRLSWDVEMSVGGCGLPLPDCIEDALLSRIGKLVLCSFNRVNLLNVDFDEIGEPEHEAADEAEVGEDIVESAHEVLEGAQRLFSLESDHTGG